MSARNLDFGSKLFMSWACLAILSTGLSFAQTRVEERFASAPAFEVASIKPNKISGCEAIFRPTDDGIRATCVTLFHLVRNAYVGTRFVDDRILGAPGWIDSDRFDVEAKVDEATASELRKLSRDEREIRLDVMLQALLAERFKLVLHKETKEGPAYALTVAKNGPRLKAGTPIDASYAGITTGIMRATTGSLIGQDVSMERLAAMLNPQFDRPVVDRTGLTGRYDFTLEWTPEQGASPMFSAPENRLGDRPADGTPLYMALQQQLGLKLEPLKVPMEVLVIDHVEKPSAN